MKKEEKKIVDVLMEISAKDKGKARAFNVFADFLNFKQKLNKDKPKFKPSKEFLNSLDEKQYKDFSDFVQKMYAENCADEILLIEFIFSGIEMQEKNEK